jgi:hypothetical protein
MAEASNAADHLIGEFAANPAPVLCLPKLHFRKM